MRNLLLAAAALGAIALVVVGLVSAGGDDAGSASDRSALTEEEARTALSDAPGALGALYGDANELLDGGAGAFEDRLAELRGTPVVVNKWASWCGPCRAEFPHFQRQAVLRGREVAFIGVDSLDNRDDAREFLKKFPVPYPSYEDPDGDVSRVFRGNVAFPTTAFYDSKGELAHVRQGQYASEEQLAEDIERHAR